MDIAEDFILHPNVNLTEELRRRGICAAKDLARLRARWRAHGRDYLEAGHVRLEAKRRAHPLVCLFDAFDGIARDAGYFASSGDVLRILDDMQRRVHAALDQEGGEKGDSETSAPARRRRSVREAVRALTELDDLDRARNACVFVSPRAGFEGLSEGDKAALFASLLHARAKALWTVEAREVKADDTTD